MPIPGLGTWFESLMLYGGLIFVLIFLSTRIILGSFKKAFILWSVIIGAFLIFAGVGTVWHNISKKHKQQEEEQKLQAFLDKSTPYFKEKCKGAGIFFYDKDIPSQESVYIMRPFSIGESFFLPRTDEVNRQYIVHDFFNHGMSGGDSSLIDTPIEGSPGALFLGLKDKNAMNYGFSYVETYLEKPTNLVRFEFIPDPKKYSPDHMKFTQTPISSISSRYGTKWEDISTKKDRDHWVAGGKRQIIDLQTNKVVAEATGYVMATNPEIFSWKHVKTCPEGYRSNEFVWSVLRSKEYKEYLNSPN